MVEERRAALAGLAMLLDVLVLGWLWWLVPRVRALLVSYWPLDLVPGPQAVFRPVDLAQLDLVGLWVVPIWVMVLLQRGAYERMTCAEVRMDTLVGAAVLATGVVATVLFLANEPHLSRTVMLGFALAAVPCLYVVRRGVTAMGARLPRIIQPVVLVGAPPALAGLEARGLADPERSLQVVARFDPRCQEGVVAAVAAVAMQGGVQEVRVAAGSGTDLEELARLCAELGLSLSVEVQGQDGNGDPRAMWLRSASRPTSSMVRKRLMDLVLTVVLMPLVLPLMGAAALWIWLVDGGPVLFSQRRVGLHGVPFTMYKFRTMVRDAEASRQQLERFNETGGPTFKMNGDPRVTWWGRTLRRWSVDELPQLWNVLMGDMSLVGPRPALPDEVARYSSWQRRRLSMRPGLTCIWQVSGRSDLDFETWMSLDLRYVDSWTLSGDLVLLLRTVPAVWRGTGAR